MSDPPYSPRARPASTLEHLLMRRMGQAIGDFQLVEPNDRILVAVSGGKDSFALLNILDLHRRRCAFAFSLLPVFVDPGWDPGAGAQVQERFAAFGFPVEVIFRDIRTNVRDHLRPGTNPCGLCSRLRRGVLYDLAPERACNKIALGHQLDDLAETLLLNLFFTGQLKSMAVRLRSDDGRNTVIRPLAYVENELIMDYVAEKGFLPVESNCPYYHESHDPRREVVRGIIGQVSGFQPRVRRSILAAMQHIRITHLMDQGVAPKPSTACKPSEHIRKKRPTRRGRA